MSETPARWRAQPGQILGLAALSAKYRREGDMGKGDRRRKHRARESKTMPLVDELALAPVPRRQPNGQKRRNNDDPQAVARASRQRHCSVAEADALDPILGTDMGRCIRALTSGDDRRELVEAWAALSAARRNYRMRIIGQTGEPQNAALPLIHDAMETDPSLTVDLRTAEERDNAAIRAWDAWSAAIQSLPFPQMKWAIRGALDGFLGEGRLWLDGEPTATGRVAVHALRKMCERS